MKTAFPESLDAWLTQIEQCHPSTIDLGLDRIRVVAQRLGLSLSRSKVITVAGTNGKGSTTTMLDSVLREAGFRCGLYTSPHFLRYNERIRINGAEVSDQTICDAFAKIETARGDISLTYFEYGTLAALLCFMEADLDYVVLEVGLGGRLDAVNLIDADVAVLTTVALDHQEWLGDTVEKIGFEKAGIFRAGKPAICGLLNPPQSVIDHAANIGAQFSHRGTDFGVALTTAESWSWFSQTNNQPVELSGLVKPTLPMINAAVVLEVLKQLGLTLTIEQINTGLSRALMTGRMQHVSVDGKQIVLDVAHNPEAAGYLDQWLKDNPIAGKNRVLIGMLADKDMRSTLQVLGDIAADWTFVTLLGPRGNPAAHLAEIYAQVADTNDKAVSVSDNIGAALYELIESSSENDRIIVCGSFLTVTEALTALKLDK